MVFKFIKKYKRLFFLFCISLIGSFLINFPFSRIPEIYQYGHEIGKFLYDLSIGYIISYIFFFMVVFIKEENDRKHINERVSLQASFLIISGYSLFSSVFDNTPELKKTFPPTQEEIKLACLAIDPFISPVGLNSMQNMPWKWLLQSKRKENLQYVQKIKSLPYIESDLFGLVTRIEDCRLFYLAVKFIFPTTKQDHFKDGTFMEPDLYNYFCLISELENYTNVNFRQFKNHKELRDQRIKSNFEY